MEEIVVITESFIYRNAENGYAIIEVCREDNDEPLVAVGVMPLAAEGERMRLSGNWTCHKQYGMQFKVSTYELLAPSTLSGIKDYLASGMIKGIGETTATLIVKKFGMKTFDIMENEPQRLLEIPGIGKVKAGMIVSSYMRQRELRDTMLALQEYDITTNQALKLYKIYGAMAVNRLRENPYRLIEDVDGIGFKIADRIAASMGIQTDSPFRVKAGIQFVLDWARQEGHTYLPYDVLVSATQKTIAVEEGNVLAALGELIITGKLCVEELENVTAVQTPLMNNTEKRSARLLSLLAKSTVCAPMFDIKHEIAALEKEYEIELAPLQRDAIENIFTRGAFVITGGPGTGKTTILKVAIGIMEKWGIKYELAAPTGRAAKRMGAATGVNARTLHRLLEYSFQEKCFMRDEECPLEAEVIIVDEMSMVDSYLMDSLLRAIPEGARLIMVGDSDQLPSVGAGNVLHDIIESNVIHSVRLREIYRQAKKSMIVTNAHRINNGMFPVLGDSASDFVFEELLTAESVLERITELSRDGGNMLFTDEPRLDIQVLAPMKKGLTGVNLLNARLQHAINPPSPAKRECKCGETLFREGDKVMQIKNDYNMEWTRAIEGAAVETGMGVFNGDIGTILSITPRDGSIDVLFDDGITAHYEPARTEELELAYCISIHKSQGSEFKIVLLPILGGPPMFMTRNLLYTAVTRAKTQVLILGSRESVNSMVKNNKVHNRYSIMRNMLERYAKC